MLIEINLLPKREKVSFQFIIVCILIGLIGLAVAGWFTFDYYSMQKKQEQMKQEMLLTTKLIEVTQQKLHQGSSSSSLIGLDNQVKLMESLPLPTVLVLNHLVGLLPSNGVYQNYSYDVKGTVSFTADFSTMREIANYLDQLVKSPNVISVNLSTVAKQGEEAKYTAQFAIQLNIDAIKLNKGEETK